MKTSKRLRRNIAIWLAAGLFMTGTAGMAAGPIMPDPKAEARHQPQVEETANGIPLVNITAPSSGGVSRNEYETFNVPDKGAILNNSYTLSKTELAGYVQGNNNMAERPAKIIVNEVTGAGPTIHGRISGSGRKQGRRRHCQSERHHRKRRRIHQYRQSLPHHRETRL